MSISKTQAIIITAIIYIIVFTGYFFINYPSNLWFISIISLVQLAVVILYYNGLPKQDRKKFWYKGIGAAVIIVILVIISMLYENYRTQKEIKRIDENHRIK